MEKMKYEEFVNIVEERIRAFLPDEEYKNAQINTQPSLKNNDRKLMGLVIRRAGCNIAPTIYLEPFYEKYIARTSLDDVLSEIAALRVEVDPGVHYFSTEQLLCFESCRDMIFPRIINHEMNKELLENRPYTTIADLAVIYVIILDSEGKRTVTISKELFDMWEITLDELHQTAMKNLSEEDKGTLCPIDSVIKEIMLPNLIDLCKGDEQMAENILESRMPQNIPMYVLTNQSYLFGSAELLNPKFMDDVVNQLGENLVILPSSIHEMLVFRESEAMPVHELRNLVRLVNQNQVSLEDRLSDQVYRYTPETGLMLA